MFSLTGALRISNTTLPQLQQLSSPLLAVEHARELQPQSSSLYLNLCRKKWNIFAWAKQQPATSSSHGRRQQVGWGLNAPTGFKVPFTLVKNNKKGTKRWGGRGGINQNDLHQPKWMCRTRTAASFFHEDLKAVNKAENHWELCPCVWTNEEANMIYSPFITFLNQILQLCCSTCLVPFSLVSAL